VSAAALETRGLCKSFGALTWRRHQFPAGGGRAPRADRSETAPERPLRQYAHRRALPLIGRIVLGGEDITATGQAKRVKLGLGRTFQINGLFRRLPVLGQRGARGGRTARRRAAHAARGKRHGDVRDESMELLATLGLAGTQAFASSTCLTGNSAWWKSPSRSD